MATQTKSEGEENASGISESRAAARGTLITLLLRLVSFFFTQATFRVLDPATLGKANIQLELLLTTVLFISREGFRLALTKNVAPENWGVAWLTIPVVTLVAGGALVWHLSVAKDKDYQIVGEWNCARHSNRANAGPREVHSLVEAFVLLSFVLLLCN